VATQLNTLDGGSDIALGQYSISGTADGLKSPRVDSVLLEDVIDFGVRLYVFDAGFTASQDAPEGVRLIFPADSSSNLSNSDTEHIASTFVGTDFTKRYPDLVEIYLRVLDDAGSRLLLHAEEVGGGIGYAEIVEKHSKVYRRLVRIPGRASKG